eukprot:183729_1
MAFHRLQGNSKFNIKTAAAASSDTLYMDEAVRYLWFSSRNLRENTIRNVWNFLVSYQYDSESIKRDITHGLASNIALNIGEDAFQALADFVKATELRRSSFSIGFTFYYWSEYRKMNEFHANTSTYNRNDHGGYKICELFVPQKHESFKEEIQYYKFIEMSAYDTTMVKVKAYMATKSAKALKAWIALNNRYFIELKYDIKHGDPISTRHFLALFFYTDFTELCTHFSATFRATKQFEQLSSIKARNSTYWWMAKSLREIVELYGDNYYSEYDEEKRTYVGLQGPFYCGLSTVMPFPEFEVR